MNVYEVQLVKNIIEIYRDGKKIIEYPFKTKSSAKEFANSLVTLTPNYKRKVN